MYVCVCACVEQLNPVKVVMRAAITGVMPAAMTGCSNRASYSGGAWGPPEAPCAVQHVWGGRTPPSLFTDASLILECKNAF